MCPAKELVNPLAEEGEDASYGGVVQYFQYDPAQSGNLVNGNLVVFEDLIAPATGPVLIKKATTTPDFRMLGVVVDAPTGGYTPGSSVAVATEGVVLALFDANNTVVNHLALCSSTTAGTLTDSSTATVGKTMGTVMEAVTIASGSALVPIYLHKM